MSANVLNTVTILSLTTTSCSLALNGKGLRLKALFQTFQNVHLKRYIAFNLPCQPTNIVIEILDLELLTKGR